MSHSSNAPPTITASHHGTCHVVQVDNLATLQIDTSPWWIGVSFDYCKPLPCHHHRARSGKSLTHFSSVLALNKNSNWRQEIFPETWKANPWSTSCIAYSNLSLNRSMSSILLLPLGRNIVASYWQLHRSCWGEQEIETITKTWAK